MDDGRLHVLFMIPTLRSGGAERVLITLLRNFDRSRFRISVAVLTLESAAYENLIPEDIELIGLGTGRVRNSIPAALRLVRRLKPDLVFVFMLYLAIGMSIVKPLFPRSTKLMFRMTAQLSAEIKVQSFLWRAALSRFIGRADLGVFQSEDHLQDFLTTAGDVGLRTAVIPNPIDFAYIRSAADMKIETGFRKGCVNLVSIGRLDPVKGYDIALKALALTTDLPINLTILGEGAERGPLERLSQALGLSDRVRFLGFQENPYRFLSEADGLLLSSRHEAFPNVVLESLACLTPVIITPVPSIEELVRQTPYCEVAEAPTAQALSDAMRRFVMRGPGNKLLSGIVDAFDVRNVVRIYEDAILSIVGPAPARS